MSQVNVKFLVLKYGKLLLSKSSQSGKWAVLEGTIDVNNNLEFAMSKVVLEKTGWEGENVRLFQISINSDESPESSSQLEVVFIVDGIRQTLQSHEIAKGLAWFPLNDLPKPEEIINHHVSIIYDLAELLHRGKTLDLEHLPPVFPLKNLKSTNTLKLLN